MQHFISYSSVVSFFGWSAIGNLIQSSLLILQVLSLSGSFCTLNFILLVFVITVNHVMPKMSSK